MDKQKKKKGTNEIDNDQPKNDRGRKASIGSRCYYDSQIITTHAEEMRLRHI